MTTNDFNPRNKIPLAREIFSPDGWYGDHGMNEPEEPLTRQDIVVRTIMRIAVFAVGLAAIVMGFTRIFSEIPEDMALSMFLIIVGLAFVHAGAALGYHFRHGRRSVTRIMFCVCFILSVVMVIFGLASVFAMATPAIFLILVGFVSAIIAAVAMN